MLTASESVGGFKEVTDAEKTAIEAADDKWTRPPQSFIDMWNRECHFAGVKDYFGKYNEDTGFFELNGLVDITYEEAMRIWARSEHGLLAFSFAYSEHFGGNGWAVSKNYNLCRTYFPFKNGSYSSPNLTNAFRCNSVVRKLAFVGGYGAALANFAKLEGAFNGCEKLESILSEIRLPTLDDNTFNGCKSLVDLDIATRIDPKTYGNVNLKWSPLISYKSISNLIAKAEVVNATNTMTVTLHPDVYAKIVDEANEEWHGLLEAAAAKNIQFATT